MSNKHQLLGQILDLKSELEDVHNDRIKYIRMHGIESHKNRYLQARVKELETEKESYKVILLKLIEMGQAARADKFSPLGHLCEESRILLEQGEKE